MPGFPPSFTTGFVQDEYPLEINGNPYILSNHTNTGPLSTALLGQPFVIKVKLYGDNGPQSVKHVTLVTNIRGNYATISGADTAISWDTTGPLQVADPHHFFGPITANATIAGNKLFLVLHGTFANPMPLSDIGIRTWGYDLYSKDVYVTDAWQATDSPSAPEYQAGTNQQMLNTNSSAEMQPAASMASAREHATNDLLATVKEWAGYNPVAISDSQMLQYMGYQGSYIPSWVMKSMAKYLVDGTITQDQFAGTIKYLVDSHIIK